MKYMLDTNIIIYLKNNRSEELIKRFSRHSIRSTCISVITLAELEYGVYKSERPTQNELALVTFLSRIKILPFDDNAAIEYGKIRAELTSKGQPIGANDLLIAAHARSEGLTLVTNNTREFSRVAELKLDDWTQSRCLDSV